MSYRVIVSPPATGDLQRLPAFLELESPRAAARVRRVLAEALASLTEFPGRGRPTAAEGVRDLPVPFGRYGYVIRYRIRGDEVVVTRIRHSRESG